MTKPLSFFLQLVFALGILAILATQVWAVPAMSASMAEIYPEVAWARWPLAVPLILALLAVQVALAAVIRLLGLVRSREIFRGAGLRWVVVMISALAVAWAISLATTVWQLATGLNQPGIFLLEVVVLLVGAAVLLLLLVMRGLLLDATALRVEMDEVV